MAPGWERWRAQLANALTPVRGWLVSGLAPRAGDTVLELGAGTGETGFEAAALAETRRVLRPGGRLALSVWGAPERNPWATIGAMTLVERGHIPPPEPGAPGVFAMASEKRTRRCSTAPASARSTPSGCRCASLSATSM